MRICSAWSRMRGLDFPSFRNSPVRESNSNTPKRKSRGWALPSLKQDVSQTASHSMGDVRLKDLSFMRLRNELSLITIDLQTIPSPPPFPHIARHALSCD